MSNSAKVGGGNRSLLLLHRGLSLNGIDATVIVPEEGQMADACRNASVDFQFQPIRQPSWRRPDRVWSSYREWKRTLNSCGPELVHANDVTTARSVSLAAGRLGLPVVCHVRYPPSQELIQWAFRRLPKPDAFVFNSHYMQRECGPAFETACPRSRQYVIHNAVDLDGFTPQSKSSDRKRVGILANLMPVKGHRDFLEMAGLLSRRGVSAEYWLIGDDIHETGYRRELEEIALNLGLNSDVHFLGHRNDIPELLNELDILVCASHVEPFGRCLIEGMACGKPVVATRVGGIPEVVEDGVTGILVSPQQPHELADAVETFLNDPGKARQMGRAGRERAKRLFATEAHVDAILEVYDAVLGKNQLRGSGIPAVNNA